MTFKQNNRNLKFYSIAILIVFFLTWNQHLKSSDIVIDSNFRSLNISEHLSIFQDTSQTSNYQDILLLGPSDFQKNKHNNFILNKRRPGSSIWLKFSIFNNTHSSKELRLSNATDLLQLNVYQFNENMKLENSMNTGTLYSVLEKPVWSNNTVIPLRIDSMGNATILMKADSDDLNREIFTLQSLNQYELTSSRNNFFNGAINGFFIIVCLIALILYLITRDTVNLYYFLYATANSLTFFIASKHFELIFMPGQKFGHLPQMVGVIITTLFFFKFILSYYEEQKLVSNTTIKFNLFAWPMYYFLVVIFFYPWIGNFVPQGPIWQRLPMILIALMSIYSFVLIIRGVIICPTRNNILFALAFFCILLSAATNVLVRNGLLNLGDIYNHSYSISLILEFSILSIALGYKMFEAYTERSVLSVKVAAQKKELLQAEQLKIAVEEKDTLLKEIHHRVKNNLQVISALLTLQSKYIKDDQAIEALREGQDRVQSMALIHKDLYQHDNLKGVNTKDYLEKLVDNLIDSYSIDDEDIMLELDIESIWLDVDTMIPMGLMVNELISNALKHAFSGQNNGALHIQLKEIDNQLILNIKDNGKGFDNFEIQKSNSFGYSLIESFAKKLDAEMNYKFEDGFGIDIIVNRYTKAA